LAETKNPTAMNFAIRTLIITAIATTAIDTNAQEPSRIVADTIAYTVLIAANPTEPNDFYNNIDSTDRLSWLAALFTDIQDGRVKANHCSPMSTPEGPMSPQEFADLLSRKDTLFTEDITSGELTMSVNEIRIKPSDIRSISFIEKWIMDPQKGLVKYVLGYAPGKAMYGDDGRLMGYMPLFWVLIP
jgi:hypothetical protein